MRIPLMIPLLPICCMVAWMSPLLSEDMRLDKVMSEEDQKRTGVYNLTPKQKLALETWINRHCQLQTISTSPEPASPLSLSINIDNGQKLQLSDNSIWEVSPDDTPISQVWISSFPIKMIPSDNPDYPILLVNKLTGVGVKVKRAQPSQPSTPPPPATQPQ